SSYRPVSGVFNTSFQKAGTSTGNFAKNRASRVGTAKIQLRDQRLSAEFPKNPSREFFRPSREFAGRHGRPTAESGAEKWAGGRPRSPASTVQLEDAAVRRLRRHAGGLSAPSGSGCSTSRFPRLCGGARSMTPKVATGFLPVASHYSGSSLRRPLRRAKAG